MPQSGGVTFASDAAKAPVSKALRIKDPVWGAFDTPSNLLAVCNACYEVGRGELISN
jgi:hypothetical protein